MSSTNPILAIPSKFRETFSTGVYIDPILTIPPDINNTGMGNWANERIVFS